MREAASASLRIRPAGVRYRQGARQQLEDDCYAHLLLEDEHLEATTRILKGFQRQLSELSAGVKQRNEKRGGYACSSFDPATMTSSVSI